MQILLLSVFIGLLYFFIFARFFSNTANENNWFNTHFRTSLAKHDFWRLVLNLHRDGDNQNEYLTKSKFAIVIYTNEENQVSPDAKNNLETEIKGLLPNTSDIKFYDGQQLDLQQSSYLRIKLRKLISGLPRKKFSSDTAILDVYIFNRSEEYPSNLGLTNQDNGVVVFWETIKNLSGQNASNFDAYISSTILHEFGHQLGLGHIDDPNCIMSQTVEVPNQEEAGNYWVVKNYCQQEKALIAAKLKLK